MCGTGIVKFFEKEHSYECDNEKYLSVSKFLELFEDEYDEEAWSWYIAVKLYYIGDYWDDKRNEWYIGGKEKDLTIVSHYPLKIWEDKKQGQNRKFLVRGDLQKEYLYKFVDNVPYRIELAILKTIVLTKWNKKNKVASEGGSKYHFEQEKRNIFNRYGIHIDEFKQKEKEKGYKESFIDIYKDVRDGLEPELLIHDHEYKIAGQLDEPTFQTKGRIRYVDIDDYKTNEGGIDRSNKFQQYKYPISHLDICKFNHYALQQSTYGYLLERKGFVVRRLRLLWRKVNFETGEVLESEDIDVPYLRNEVIAMINYYRQSQEPIKNKSIWDSI